MSQESPEEESTRQSLRQPQNIETYSGRAPKNYKTVVQGDDNNNRDSDNELTFTLTPAPPLDRRTTINQNLSARWQLELREAAAGSHHRAFVMHTNSPVLNSVALPS